MKNLKHLFSFFTLFTSSFCYSDPSFENPLQNEYAMNVQQIQKQESQKKDVVTFIPPKGWKNADLEKLPKSIKVMLVGTGKDHFPPSLSLALEPYKGSLQDYLKIVKDFNLKEKTDWKNLGKIETKAGIGNLSQFDEKSNWGETRTMTTIVVKNGNAYILSATALKSEFSSFYKEFFEAMRSLEIKNEAS